jgi:glycosyltransferase involved in cell wall biosynthesis
MRRDSYSTENLVKFHPTAVVGAWLRVLFVTSMWPDNQRPHYGTFIQTQAESLEDCGVGIDVLVIRGYITPLAYPLARPRIKSLVKERHYDLIHVHTGHAATVALPGLRKPSVLSFVGGDVLGNPTDRGTPINSRLEARVLRQLARASTRSITKSREMERALPRSLRARNHVIPNGVNLEAFTPRPRAEARAALNWDQDELVALFLGDPNDPRKNVSLARAAVSELQSRAPNVRLHIGWGSHPQEIPSLMWAADALIFTSRSEGSPNVVKEAMAAALPIVATSVGDIPERLEEVPGCFVVSADPDSFAEALTRAFSFGRAPAAREAVQALSLQHVANRVAKLYENVTGITRPAMERRSTHSSVAPVPSMKGDDNGAGRVHDDTRSMTRAKQSR